MRTLDKLLAPHLKLAPVLVKRAPTLTLAFDERRKSRLAVTLGSGEEVALLLPRGTVLRDGDVLIADDGALVHVVAAAETVLVVRAKDAVTLTRAAYHLGNRHTPVEVGADYLKLEYDPVLADMLTRIGATVEQASLPFQPESGAYGGGHKHGHDETFAEDYALAQQVFGEHHGHEHSHDHSHEHGDDHNHAHDHADHVTTKPAATHTTNMRIAELTALLHLASPALPIGAFSYSQGLEAAIEAHLITDADSARAWIASGLADVLARGELPFLAHQMERWRLHDAAGLADANSEFLASRESAELRRETEQMGWSLRQLCVSLEWGDADRRATLASITPLAQPTAFAFAAYAHDVAVDAALAAYAFSWVENQAAAALKAVPLGQLAGQRIIVALREPINAAVARAMATSPDTINTFAPQLGILSARHESQYSRLFRS